MGFFYRDAKDSDEYIGKIADIHSFGVPKNFLTHIDLLWSVALRLCNYNPADANRVLDQCTAKEIYEAYVIYKYDKFGDA